MSSVVFLYFFSRYMRIAVINRMGKNKQTEIQTRQLGVGFLSLVIFLLFRLEPPPCRTERSVFLHLRHMDVKRAIKRDICQPSTTLRGSGTALYTHTISNGGDKGAASTDIQPALNQLYQWGPRLLKTSTIHTEKSIYCRLCYCVIGRWSIKLRELSNKLAC